MTIGSVTTTNSTFASGTEETTIAQKLTDLNSSDTKKKNEAIEFLLGQGIDLGITIDPDLNKEGLDTGKMNVSPRPSRNGAPDLSKRQAVSVYHVESGKIKGEALAPHLAFVDLESRARFLLSQQTLYFKVIAVSSEKLGIKKGEEHRHATYAYYEKGVTVGDEFKLKHVEAKKTEHSGKLSKLKAKLAKPIPLKITSLNTASKEEINYWIKEKMGLGFLPMDKKLEQIYVPAVREKVRGLNGPFASMTNPLSYYYAQYWKKGCLKDVKEMMDALEDIQSQTPTQPEQCRVLLKAIEKCKDSNIAKRMKADNPPKSWWKDELHNDLDGEKPAAFAKFIQDFFSACDKEIEEAGANAQKKHIKRK